MAKGNRTSQLDELFAGLRDLTDQVEAATAAGDSRAVRVARGELDRLIQRLSSFAAILDPVLRPASIFDPSDPKTAGSVVALTLVAQNRYPLSSIPEFYGAGIYAIYYTGKYEAYLPLSGTDHPIYVGKADPNNPSAKDAIAQGIKLSARLEEHAKSIGKAKSTLDLGDFDCRFLIVQTGFQKSAEDYLINFFKPIWNSETKICFGLGKHGDSANTRGNKRSPWDTLHPGRGWADASAEDQKSKQLINQQISAHFAANRVYSDIHAIFDRFVGDIQQIDPAHIRPAIGVGNESGDSA